MESANTSSLIPKEDKLASVRKGNRRLIISFFSLIIILALTIGAIVFSLVRKYNHQQSLRLNPTPGVREFCSVTYPQFTCTNSVHYSIKSTPQSTPNQIFRLSLETATERLSNTLLLFSQSDSSYDSLSRSIIRNCSSSLRDSMSQLNNTIPKIGLYPSEETRNEMIASISVAIDDLSSCLKAFESVPFAVMGDQGGVKDLLAPTLYSARALVRYSKNYLLNFDYVNESFRVALVIDGEDWRRIVEDLSAATLFGSHYFVLVFLFCLLLRVR